MIKNSDGSEYRLRGPNPLMAGQSIWENAVGHNLDLHQEASYVPHSQRFKESFINTPVQESAPSRPVFDLEPSARVRCWVLPTELKTTVDPVYGQSTRRLVWGNKFSMDVVIEKIGDVFSAFWTDAIKLITPGSIFFVERRHWKVTSSEAREGGISIKCSITDQTPSFD